MRTQLIKRAGVLGLILAFAFSALGTTPVRAVGVCYVNAGASGANNGSSWSNAYTNLQSALADATCVEIWVVKGIYKPTSSADRTISFALKSGVALYGGFTGTETARDQRNWEFNTTTLSGDLLGNDSDFTNNDENSYHVVTGSGVNNTAILDGFIISAGNSMNIINGRGGGMYNSNGSPTLANVTFSSNSAWLGGGMHNTYNSSPILTNVTFSGNTVISYGGGMYNDSNSSPILTNVTFSGNIAYYWGGGMYNYTNSSPTLNNVTFSGNTAYNAGGGMYNYNNCNPILTNVILWGDSALTGAEIFNDTSIYSVNPSIPRIQNSIVQGSGASGGAWNTTLGTDKGGNLDTDPRLGPLQNNGGFTQTLALLSGSSAIDAGDNTSCPPTDQRGVARPQGKFCDIGAYEAPPILKVISSTPVANATLTSLSAIKVNFNENTVSDGSIKAANNTANYLLVERGTNGTFDTISCSTGLASDDVKQIIASATYNNNSGSGPLTATLSLANPLANGHYRLFICGTTSIWSAAGLELNNGANDTTVDFTIQATASSLPATGFAPGRITRLPAQPAEKAHSQSDLWLEIPKLGVKMDIVGIPQVKGTWDVSWLGNSAGWLEGSAFPTWEGNSVITGHVWNADNTPGVFASLKTLKYGDQIKIHAFGQVYTYEVRESKRISASSVQAVMKHEKLAWLTLITCEDYREFWNTYSGRRMVRAVLVSIK